MNRLFVMCCIFWIEKLIVLTDFFQIFSIIWITAQSWRWPFLWLHGTKWILIFNFDGFTIFSTQGQLINGYLIYVIGFNCALILFYVSYLSIYKFQQVYGKRNDIPAVLLLNILSLLGYSFYTPLLLAQSRLYYYDSITCSLSADPTVSCQSVSYVLLVVFTSMITIPFLMIYPMRLQLHINTHMWQSDADQYEFDMEVHELSYLLQIRDNWWSDQLSQLTPLALSGRYFYLHVLVYKVMLVFAFIALKSSILVQSSFMFIVTVLFFSYYGLFPPFRCISTNKILKIVGVLLLISVSFGMANTYQVVNAITVGSVETLWLLVTFCVGALLLVTMVIQCVVDSSQIYLSCQLYQYIMTECIYNKYDVTNWVSEMRLSVTVLFNFQQCCDVTADINAIQNAMTTLSWYRSQFTKNTNETLSHHIIVLARISDDLFDEISYECESRVAKCLRKNKEWNQIYQECSQLQVFQKRWLKLLSISPCKRRILNVILAYRAFATGLTISSPTHPSNISDYVTRKYRMY